MGSTSHETPKGVGGVSRPQKHRRRRPSPTEQARREAWGHKFGALVRDAYKEALQREEGR